MDRKSLVGLAAGALVALACAQPRPPLAEAEPSVSPATFSGARAFAQLERLVAIGPRVSGTPGAAAAQTFVRQELEALGLGVTEEAYRWTPSPDRPEKALANLWVELPGEGAARFAFATALDTHPSAGAGANESGSGVAVLLELARVLQQRPLPYPVRLLFLDGELLDAETPYLGSEHAYLGFETGGLLESLRAVVYVQQVGDRDLEVHRDRRSDRVLREFFFRAAEGLGLAAAFPPNAPFDEPKLGHEVFLAHHFTRVVALADVRYGGPDAPGPLWRTAGDELAACSPESLEAAGRVLAGGLVRLFERQRSVDRARGAAR